MICVSFKTSTKKIHLLGNIPEELSISLKNLGYRSVPRSKELCCSHDIYLSTKHLLGKVFENKETIEFFNSLKSLEEKNNSIIQNYLDKKLGPFKLFPYQEEFVRFYNDPLEAPHAVFNASSPGLGKTTMALSAIFVTKPNCPLIILCPKNAVGVWKWHLEKFNYSLPIYTEFKPGKCACICTYDSIPPKIEEALGNKKPLKDFKSDICKETVLISDEFHLVKNAKAIRTLRFRELFKYVRDKDGKCIALTGTPVLNKCVEFKVLLDNLDLFKKTFGNASNFYKLFGGEFNPYLRRIVWDESKRNPEEIKERVKQVLFIRKKEEVLEQIPDKVNTVIPVEITKKSIIKDLDSLNEKFKKHKDKLSAMTKTDISHYTLLREVLSSLKLKILTEKVEYFEEVEKPIIVFSDFVSPVKELAKRQGWACICGDTSAKERTKLEKDFNSGKLKGLAITIRAGGTALSLTNTDTMLFLDLNLTPGLNIQAKNRIDRVSKINKSLTYLYFMSNHIFEKEMHDMLIRKERLVDDVI